MAAADRTYWMLVSSPENFEISRGRGFDVAGMKSRHGNKAKDVMPGDRVVFYLTGVQAFGGTAEVTSPAREDHARIWPCSKDNEEDYPFRFEIRMEATCPAGDYEPVAPLVPHLEYPRKWPAEHWRLAFQGNVHRLPEKDYDTIRVACHARERGRPRPPGVPPTEAEKRPPIPSKLRKPPPK
jgi:hypothetical protein